MGFAAVNAARLALLLLCALALLVRADDFLLDDAAELSEEDIVAHAKAAAHAAHAHTDAEATIAAQSASTKQHTSTARAAGPTQGNAATVSATSQLDKRELAASANAGLPAEALFQLPIIGTVLGAFFLLCGLALLASGLLCKVSEAHEIPARSKLVAGAVCAAAGLTILLCALLIR